MLSNHCLICEKPLDFPMGLFIILFVFVLNSVGSKPLHESNEPNINFQTMEEYFLKIDLFKIICKLKIRN